jgi:DNA (cytosine-5)-methyltransferase 1
MTPANDNSAPANAGARAYYNEIDPYAAQWLRNLIAANLIALGDVDERSIADVHADDLRGYSQCHFFAGIGGWSYALRLAGWPDSRPVWTGSCPCQPFSVGAVSNGGGKGQEDERHLLPVFAKLVAECKPSVVFGEQVANAIKWGWLDEAFTSFEAINYACGAAVMPALVVGARHERKRLYWVADSLRQGWSGYQQDNRAFGRAAAPLAFDGDTLARAGRALDGDYSDLLSGDGVPVSVERCATKGYGNAIYPKLAAEFIGAFMDCMPPLPANDNNKQDIASAA